MRDITVRVPASTSNLGPGFDCFGVALRLYNEVTLVRGGGGERPSIVTETASSLFKVAGVKPFDFACRITDAVPRARGLGSSATVRVGLLLGLAALAQARLSDDRLFELATSLEGHPDNVAPALFGGFNLVAEGGRMQFPVASRLRFVLLVPEFSIQTAEARRLLPPQIPRRDAVTNTGNAAALAAAFASRRYESLQGSFRDYVHQPFRKPLVPFLDDVITAGEKAGALGGFLSGSGSTIACLTLTRPERVAAAMRAVLPKKIQAGTIIASADNRGARWLRK